VPDLVGFVNSASSQYTTNGENCGGEIADESSETSLLLSEAPTWLANASVPAYLGAIAHHTYDNPSDSTLEQVGGLADVNDKPVWATEICSSALGCDPATDSTCATSVNSSGWNDGLIYYDPSYASDGNQHIYMTKRFYVLGQYSKYVRPGAVR
jgi:hypothetical protein